MYFRHQFEKEFKYNTVAYWTEREVAWTDVLSLQGYCVTCRHRVFISCTSQGFLFNPSYQLRDNIFIFVLNLNFGYDMTTNRSLFHWSFDWSFEVDFEYLIDHGFNLTSLELELENKKLFYTFILAPRR